MPQEHILENKKCKVCGTGFNIESGDLIFYDKISPVFNGIKYPIPSPTLCPDCRKQRRLSTRNERNLYKRNCDATGKPMISIYGPHCKGMVYHQDEWWSDRWDPLDYGMQYDSGKSFFPQFGELLEKVPKLSVVVMNAENSEYTNGGVGNKDCYMIYLSSHNEKSLYSRWIFDSNNLLDCSNINRSENCYELIRSDNCFDCFYSIYLEECSNCYFSFNLKGCTNCINCENLSNQSFCIDNVQVTREEFEERLKKINFKEDSKEFKKKYLSKKIPNFNCENCTGHDLKNSKNVLEGEDGSEGQDCRFIGYFLDIKDSYDINFQAYETSLVYESLGFEKVNSSMGVFLSVGLSDVFYSQYCFNSSNLFGCVGLSNKEYCILNRQYTKEEYMEIVPKMISHMTASGEWGEFFPSTISPFGYNETAASDYFPLTKEEALRLGFNWSDYENPRPDVSKIIPACKLPQDINDVPDDILNWAIEGEKTRRPFRIIRQELEFYRKYGLPIPSDHPDERHVGRLQK